MAAIDDLKTAKANIAARLAAITADPKPSYTVGDQTFQWNEYFEKLTAQLKEINLLISIEDGPQEYDSQAYST